jgi:hypothetical protein
VRVLEAPKKQPQSKGPNVWAVGFAALFAGYLMGQYGASGAQQADSAAPSIAPVVAPSTTDMNAVDMNATDLNATAAVAAPAVVPAEATEANAADSTETTDQPTYAYAPGPTAPAATDDSDAPAAQVASSDDPSSDDATTPAVPAATVASSVPTYQPHYSYSTPSTGYSGSSSNCVGTGCYGVISNVTGLPRTTYVHGYFRKNGTYVQPYYRSHRH